MYQQEMESKAKLEIENIETKTDAASHHGKPVNRQELYELSTQPTDVLQDTEDMMHRHGQEKEDIIGEIEEQLALANQQTPSPATSMSGAQQTKEAIQPSNETRSPHTTIQTTTSTDSSFRTNFPALHRLSDQSHFLLKKFKLKRSCFRLCYYDNSIYCCCYSDSSIDVYTLSGGFIRSIALSDIRDLRALHPLSTGLLVMASGNGLFIMSGDVGGITCIKKGSYQDVHVNGSNMVTLKHYESDNDFAESDSVCVLNAMPPYQQKAAFTLGHTRAETVLLYEDTVYVSDREKNQVIVYSLREQLLPKTGGMGTGETAMGMSGQRKAVPYEIGGYPAHHWPSLCATDRSGSVLVADELNSELKLVTSRGKRDNMLGVKVWRPTDVILLADMMWVLHGGYDDRQISVYTAFSSSSISFRNNVPGLHRLSYQRPSLENNFKLKKKCFRLCYDKYEKNIFCCCLLNDCIDVYSLEGKFRKTIVLGDIRHPRALHILIEDEGLLVLAAGNGLFVMGINGEDITCVIPGSYQDVHVNGSNMVTLKKYDSDTDSDSVCVLKSVLPCTQLAMFTLGHTKAHTLLLHQDNVYVSDLDTFHVTAYSLTGQRLSQWGGRGTGGQGELYGARLCATGHSGWIDGWCMLVADVLNSRLQMLTAEGEWAVVPGVDLVWPSDVLLLTDRMWVVHGSLCAKQISVYKI